MYVIEKWPLRKDLKDMRELFMRMSGEVLPGTGISSAKTLGQERACVLEALRTVGLEWGVTEMTSEVWSDHVGPSGSQGIFPLRVR